MVDLVREEEAESLQEVWAGERGLGILVPTVVEWAWCSKALVWAAVVLE